MDLTNRSGYCLELLLEYTKAQREEIINNPKFTTIEHVYIYLDQLIDYMEKKKGAN